MISRRNFFTTILIIIIAILVLRPFVCKKSVSLPSHSQEKKSLDSLQMITGKQNAAYEDSIYTLTFIANEQSDSISQLKKQLAIAFGEVSISKNRARIFRILMNDALKNKDSVGFIIGCDSLADEFDAYIIKTDKEEKLSEDIILKQSLQLATVGQKFLLCDSSRSKLFNSFNTVKSAYDNLYKDYGKARQRNKLYMGLDGAYSPATQLISVGASGTFLFKSGIGIRVGALINTKAQTTVTGGVLYLIHF